ncbi:MAG: copper resistance protein CopC/CopD [Actinobacteria bacterium]|nr:copper resistance protein CopC/CopD [Actinomycetota bacterium]
MRVVMVRRWLVGALVALAAVLLVAGPASAHLDLVKTTPADGAELSKPVKQVQLQSNVPGEPAGAGIVLLDRTGQEVPIEVSTPDEGLTWVAKPLEALDSGKYGVKWRVAAPDTHPKTGAFRFSVNVPGAVAPADSPTAQDQGAASSLDEILAQPVDTTVAQWVRWGGTTLMITGAVLGIGGLVFLALVMAGRRSEVRTVVQRVRWSAALLIVGSFIQIAARSTMRQDGDWAAGLSPNAIADLLGSGTYGVAVGLRLLGGVLILVGVWAAFASAPTAALATTHHEPDDPIVSASLRRSWVAVIGACLYLASFLFDGHTETAAPRVLVWLSDIVHVLAAATWVGGIAMLATVLWRRRRARHALDAAFLAVRFSSVAGLSLVLAGLAGVALTVEILDEPSQLWSSTWGLVLIAKVALVAVVAAIGAYNHFRLIPVLEQAVDLRTNHPHLPEDLQPESPAPHGASGGVALATRQRVEVANDRISRKLWFTAYAEVLILLGVVALTAWLVNASAVG